MSKSVKALTEQMESLLDQLKTIEEQISRTETRLIKAKSNLKFKFPDGKSYKYNQIQIVTRYYHCRGLGYEDDYEQFSEHVFLHPETDTYVRFLSEQSIIKYLPYEYKDYYGTKKIFQKEYLPRTFTDMFKSHEYITNANQSVLKNRRFWNL